jgi:uncharacterized protein (TIGR02246 family)
VTGEADPADGAHRADGRDVARMERERLRALVARDLDRAAELHADDFQLVTPSGRTLSRDEYLESIRTHDIDYATWEPGEMAVRLYRDAAVLRYRAEISFMVDGIPTPHRAFWHIDVYERRDGRWQVIWSQATEIRV